MVNQDPPREPSATPSPATDLAEAPDLGGDGPDTGRPVADFPVVGIGASAGGLAAFEALLRGLPADTGMAFVMIQHMSPRHESLLPEILARATAMPVQVAGDGIELEPDHVYVIPPGTNLGMVDGTLVVVDFVPESGRHLPVDYFLKSLADDRGSRSVGVILSGTASDGTRGLEAIKAVGGVTFAEDQESAEFSGMPASAAAAGCVDFVLPPAGIAVELVRLARHPYLAQAMAAVEPITEDNARLMNQVFLLLRTTTGHDFSHYKRSTIDRRIKRRMAVNRMERLADYVALLQRTPAEVRALFEDILIKVTSFFRDPDSFEALKANILPALLDGRGQDRPLRIWVPACSSGEEAYSVAIAVVEAMDGLGHGVPVQIFGTDIDEAAIDQARRGYFPGGLADHLSPQRLRRFFVKAAGGYQVSRAIRDLCVFAVQNVTRDPPFSRMDLVCCRNLLIYLGPVLQKKVAQVFHYALQPKGFLMLGLSETVGSREDLFYLVDRHNRIYARKSLSSPIVYDFATTPGMPEAGIPVHQPPRSAGPPGPRAAAERLILAQYQPPGVVVNQAMEVLEFFGDNEPYIQHPPGAASFSLTRLARKQIAVVLRSAVGKAIKGREEVRHEGLEVPGPDGPRRFHLVARPLPDTTAGTCCLVLFEPAAVKREPVPPATAGDHQPSGLNEEAYLTRILELEKEQAETREYMQAVIEDQEATNEELMSAGEEIQSANEELQSTNEELMTAKEEMQSTNEELATVNEELDNRNQQLSETNNDLHNLMASVELPIVMLDTELNVRQFTPQAQPLFNLMDADTGRPIRQLRPILEIPDLEQVVRRVIDRVEPWNGELQSADSRWYTVRIRPYKTLDMRIGGVVITCIDIDDIKNVEDLRALLARERRLAAVVRDSNDAITVQDLDGRIQAWNPAAERIYGYTEAEAMGMDIVTLTAKDDRENMSRLLQQVRDGATPLPTELERVTKDGAKLRVWLVISPLVDEQGRPAGLATTERPVRGEAG